MSRSRLIIAVLTASIALLEPAASDAQSPTSKPVTRESSNPINDQGSSFEYRSFITAIDPHVAGLELQVLEFADRLQLTNHTGRTVTIYGYEHEPYARALANGTVEVNTHSPAYFLNQNFYGDVNVPSYATAQAAAHWVVVDRTGQFEWHDHRIHWMSPVTPPEVKDKGKRTKIFNWQVPIQVGAQKGNVKGELFWVPESSKTPTAAILALIVFCVLAVAFVLFVRRRRSRLPPAGDADVTGPEPGGVSKEAW
jgi:hypothetical protein